MKEEIISLAGELSGVKDSPLLELLCTAAYQSWEERLREDVTAEACGAAFCCAAALTAAAELSGGRSGIDSFSVGALSVKAAEGAGAKEMHQAAERLMSPYVKQGTFAFRGVRG